MTDADVPPQRTLCFFNTGKNSKTTGMPSTLPQPLSWPWARRGEGKMPRMSSIPLPLGRAVGGWWGTSTVLISQCHAPALDVKRKSLLQKLQHFFISLSSPEKFKCFPFIRFTHPELKGLIEIASPPPTPQHRYTVFFSRLHCFKLLSTFGFGQMNNLQY